MKLSKQLTAIALSMALLLGSTSVYADEIQETELTSVAETNDEQAEADTETNENESVLEESENAEVKALEDGVAETGPAEDLESENEEHEIETEATVCEEESPDLMALTGWDFLESHHPYYNSYDNTWKYTATGSNSSNVQGLNVTFDSRTYTQQGYDFIYIYDMNNVQIGKYSGTQLGGKTITVPGNTVYIRLTTNGSVTQWGFKVTNVTVATGPVVAKLPAVTNLKATSGSTGVKLTWSPVSGANGYLIYGFHGSPKTAAYGYIGMTSGGTTYTDARALSSDYNYYYVFAFKYDSNGKMVPGVVSDYVYGKKISAAPSTPVITKLPAVTNVRAASGSTGVTLTWSRVSGANGYLIYVFHCSPKTATYGYIGMTSNLSFTDTKAISRDYNYYYVFAYKYDSTGKMVPGAAGSYVYGKKVAVNILSGKFKECDDSYWTYNPSTYTLTISGTSIPNYLYQQLSFHADVKVLIFKSGIKYITGMFAFNNFTNLRKVYIPLTAQYASPDAFSDYANPNINDVYYEGTASQYRSFMWSDPITGKLEYSEPISRYSRPYTLHTNYKY